MRVLHCTYWLAGGGAERQLKLLADVSHELGIDAGIFCVNDEGNDIADTSVQIFRSSHQTKFNYYLFRDIQRTIAQFKPDIVHVWLPQVVTIPAMLNALVARVPCVFSYRNAMQFHRLLTIPEYVCALGIADRIVSNNPASQSSYLYKKLFTLKRGAEIRNAVRINPEFRKTSWASEPGASKEVLFVGRLTQQKNWKCLLDALQLVKSGHRWRLTICGDGEDRPLVESYIRELDQNDRVSVIGYQSEIYNIMNRAYLLVLPSWYEGMPNVLLEALAIGLPCIVSDISIHRELTENGRCAMLFDPVSAVKLASRIEKAFADPTLLERLARAGFDVAESHTATRMGEEYRIFYESILIDKCRKSFS